MRFILCVGEQVQTSAICYIEVDDQEIPLSKAANMKIFMDLELNSAHSKSPHNARQNGDILFFQKKITSIS